jgi:hypothetical protein
VSRNCRNAGPLVQQRRRGVALRWFRPVDLPVEVNQHSVLIELEAAAACSLGKRIVQRALVVQLPRINRSDHEVD